MNSSLQCLHSIEELKEPLSKFTKISENNSESIMVSATKDLWKQIDVSRTSVSPMALWLQLRTNFVRFDEQVRPGIYQQQDAEEFWGIMITSLRSKLPSGNTHKGVVQSLLEIEMEETYTNVEDKTEIVNKNSNHTKLICNIDDKIDYTTESLDRLFGVGILEEKKEIVEFSSKKSGKNTQFIRDLRISKLPKYVTLHYSRFYAKKKEGEIISVKINRVVDIPFTIDMYKYCTPNLQATFKREAIIDNKKKEIVVEEKRKQEEEMVVEDDVKSEPNLTGIYDLWAVLTHQGRTLQGGHYVAFVRQSADENDWLLFDDEKVSSKKSIDVKNLSGAGGADSHIAYMCFYKARCA